MSRQISAFFNPNVNVNKRKLNEEQACVDSNNNDSKSVTASVKTVKKWEKEFQIPIGFEKSGEVVSKIWCDICVNFATDRSSSLVTGLTRVKKESIGYHVKSSAHERAVAARLAKELKDKNEITPLDKGFQKSDEKTLLKMDKLFRTAFYLVTQERPFTDFKGMLQLQKSNGVEMGEAYFNDKSAKEFSTVISDVYFEELKDLLHSAEYFSVFCDGSTDRTETDKELVMIKILKKHYHTMIFLSLEEPPTTKAPGILAALNNAFAKFELPNWKKKLIGFCSDGASVNMGQVRGVSALLKQESQWIISVWCLAHRLELAIKDAFKSTYMDNVIEILTSVYYFYKGSAKRNREAEELAEIMDEHFLKPAKCNGTRWVEHKLQAVSKLLRNWAIIVSHMSNYAEDNTNRGEDRAKAKGIIQKLCQYKFVFYLYFLKDVLSEVSRISLTFQRDDINVSSAVTVLQGVNATLNDMINNPGAQLLQFDNDVNDNKLHDFTLRNVVDRAVLNEQIKQIILSILDCIQARFENLHTDVLFRACHVFDHKNWPNLNTGDALVQYGVAEIQQVVEHFHQLLQGCDTVAALREWVDLKAHIARNEHFKTVHPLSLFQRIAVEDDQLNNFQNILKIIHLTSCYPLSNAACERGFSTMKRIKSDWRCRLSNDTINILMRIDMGGKGFDEFNPRPFVNRWWFNGHSSKRPNTVPYGPRQ